MDTLVEKLSKSSDYFSRFSGIPDISGKYFRSLLNSPNLITQKRFGIAMYIKQFNVFSFVKV